MKFKKTLSLLLASLMVIGSASIAATAAEVDGDEVGAYSNQTYLESYASAAYNEQNLGSTYSPSQTTFKTWSPDASSVTLKVYKTGSDKEAGAGVVGEYAMTKNSTTGVWSYSLSGDHKNEYYTYIVKVNGQTNETQDVYAKATGVNGNRSMIVDLDSTDPAGWDSDKHVLFDNAGEAVVWEVHVRDFSASETSGVSSENRGKYLAFAEGGTTLNGQSGSIATGIDYLVEQGINCVQLMPVYDFQSVDESIPSSSTNRNWGYDPQNYNVPEGSYSSNPYDGNVRITEFKQMIQALHDRGISVVMDVVYNHTFNLASPLEKTAPKYYYRMSSSSVYSNGSGCGNETASDKKMYRKYMIESVKYWAEEYHIDGFRFDLMGLHDVQTMNDIRAGLDGLYSDNSGQKILMYGEPWTGGTTPNPDPIYSWQGTGISRLNARVGAFGDQYRDAIKGSTDGAEKGFVQGNTSSNTGNVVLGVQGQPYKVTAPKGPAQAISYADAHDNLIMWDKICKSNSVSNYTGTTAALQKQMKEIYTLLLTSQGIPFMTAGSEFGRTKQGDHNSYKSADSINAIDWNRVQQMSGLASYYKGLLQIRKNYSALHSSTIIKPSFQSNYGDVVAYTYTNNKSGEWNKLAVLVNGGSKAYDITLAGSGWEIVASSELGAGLKSLGKVSGSTYNIPAKGSAVLVDSASFNNLKVTEEFGTLTVNHVDQSGTVLKTQTSKYRAGSTYRAIPDSDILYDYTLVETQGSVSGTVAAGQDSKVTFVYKRAGSSGYVTVNYMDQNGKTLKDAFKERYKEGEKYSTVPAEIQGYQLDTDHFPALTSGTFVDNVTINYVYKPLSATQSTVHWKNSKNWSSVRCYAYYTDGAAIVEPNGKWDAAPVMTNDSSMGSGWLTSTVKAPMARVMFHTTTMQEPGQGEDGYLVSGEAWIENGVVSFSTTIVTSHIDAATGRKIAADEIVKTGKVKSTDTYTTSPLAGRTDVVTPPNATGTYSAGVVNVVYLYTGDEPQPTTAKPEPTTAKPEPTTKPESTTAKPESTTKPEPTTVPPTPGKRVLIGDVNMDGKIDVVDATEIQKIAAELYVPTEEQKLAADTDGNGVVTVPDATYVQSYAAGLPNSANVGKYTAGPEEPTQPVQPTNPAETTVYVEPTTAYVEPTTAYVEPTTVYVEPTTEYVAPTDPQPNNTVYLNPAATSTGEEVWYAYAWTDAEEQWIAGVQEGDTWRFDGVTGANIIFVRMDPEKADMRWDGAWNQTADLTTELGGTYTTTGWGEGWGATLEGSW